MRPRREFNVWSSVSDLAMGLMAVMALVLLLLLVQQKDDTRKAEIARADLEKQRTEFALKVLEIVSLGAGLDSQKDAIQETVKKFFLGGCQLKLDEKGVLRPVEATESGAADLYPPGETILSPDARSRLATCAETFSKLAKYLGDELPQASEPRFRKIRDWIDAIVLEGNTDRTPYLRGQVPRISSNYPMTPSLLNFLGNSFLGAERARQAMGNLLLSVAHLPGSNPRELAILLNRVRVESASSSRYQEGPAEEIGWVEPDCSEQQPQEACDMARNLSLKIRWKEQALTGPFNLVNESVCKELHDKDSVIREGLRGATLNALLKIGFTGKRSNCNRILEESKTSNRDWFDDFIQCICPENQGRADGPLS